MVIFKNLKTQFDPNTHQIAPFKKIPPPPDKSCLRPRDVR